MQFTAQTVVLIGLLAVIPALIVAVVLFLRVEAFARRFDALDMRFHGIEALEKLQLELRQDCEANKAKILNLDESFVNLSNKWNARSRTEAARVRREEKELQEPEDTEIPGTEQQVLPLPPLQPQPEAPKQQRRKFGMFPSKPMRRAA